MLSGAKVGSASYKPLRWGHLPVIRPPSKPTFFDERWERMYRQAFEEEQRRERQRVQQLRAYGLED